MTKIKNIGVIGHIDVGSTCIGLEALHHIRTSLKKHEVIEIGSNEEVTKERGITINEMIKQDKSFKITNTYEDSLMDYNINYHKKKSKKPYWSKGKLKYK